MQAKTATTNIETIQPQVNQYVSDNISIILPNQPMFPEHAVNKQYVDSSIQNLKIDKAILKFHDPKLRLPISPKVGERFISSGTGNGWVINHIYEYMAVHRTSISFCVIPEKVDDIDILSLSKKLALFGLLPTKVTLSLNVTTMLVFTPFFLRVYVLEPVPEVIAVLFIII